VIPDKPIRAEGLNLRYPNGKLALDGASLSVGAGELVVILGANGSGKSTLLRCIAGMLRPTSGQVNVAGQRIPAGCPEIAPLPPPP
jgi:phosphonate transport system ATP-binding protein